VKRATTATGLRELLLADYRRRLERWRIPGRVYEREQALESGAPVEVSATDLMLALMHAGLPDARFAFGGVAWDKVYLLDERDRMIELAADA
jgi:hypothetical protein